jgi:uncharacterized protein (TIGR00369 family)
MSMAGARDPASIRLLVETVTALPGYTSSVGTRVVAAEPGRVHLLVDRRSDLLQFNGFFHGGVIAGLADHAAGGAVTTLLPVGRIAVTVDLSVNFLAPADGDSIVARAEAVQVGTTICVARVDVVTVDDRGERSCAICVATLRSVPMPALDSATGASRIAGLTPSQHS